MGCGGEAVRIRLGGPKKQRTRRELGDIFQVKRHGLIQVHETADKDTTGGAITKEKKKGSKCGTGGVAKIDYYTSATVDCYFFLAGARVLFFFGSDDPTSYLLDGRGRAARGWLAALMAAIYVFGCLVILARRKGNAPMCSDQVYISMEQKTKTILVFGTPLASVLRVPRPFLRSPASFCMPGGHLDLDDPFASPPPLD